MKLADFMMIVIAIILFSLSFYVLYKINTDGAKCMVNVGQYLVDGLERTNKYPVACNCVLMDNKPNTPDITFYSKGYGHYNITIFP